MPDNTREENFQGAGFYYDGQMDDARVTLDVILSAEQHGCIPLNYAEVIGVSSPDDTENGFNIITVKDHYDSTEFTIKAKLVVIATGHWSDSVIEYFKPGLPTKIRPTKGIHLIVKKFYDLDNAVVVPVKDGRIIFIVPFGDYNLIGTTDTDYTGDPDHVPVTSEDVDYLINAINDIFPGSITEKDIVSAYSGIRPLVQPEKAVSESDVSRTHRIYEILENSVFCIAGGKFTTYRQMAEDMVDKVEVILGQRESCSTKKVHLHGWNRITRKNWNSWADNAVKQMKTHYGLEDDIARHLLKYGIHHAGVCELFQKNPELKARISSNRPNYYVLYEKALTLNDVMLRRTQIQLSYDQGFDCIDKIARRLGDILGWNPEKIELEKQQYRNSLPWMKN
ncbi:MAG: glycerol-3-phosphate dehydrogenase/oxidase [Candidatus Hodarchaeales archaeon]